MDRDFTQEDLEQNRTMAALGYIVFFVPLIKCRDSKVGRYCANQGLILLVLMILVSILFNIFAVVPFIGWLFTLLGVSPETAAVDACKIEHDISQETYQKILEESRRKREER